MNFNNMTIAALVIVTSVAWTTLSTSGKVFAQDTDNELHDESTIIRGVVTPAAKATLASGVVARISRMPFQEGMSFLEGEVLVEFDCSRVNAQLSAISAQKSIAHKNLVINRELASHDAVGTHEVSVSKLELQRATAEHQAQLATHDECILHAPFAGRVVRSHVNEFETPPMSSTLLEIINDSEPELELIVPSKWLKWVRTDTSFQFYIDETDETYMANVTRIGATVDPVSQTVKISGKLQGPSDQVLVGMSGTASFPTPTVQSAWNDE